MSLFFAAAFVNFLPQFHIEGVKDDDFVENTTLLYKFWYLSMATMLVRFKYYFAWLFADAICNNSGIGFAGYDANGGAMWDKFSNIHIFKFEVSYLINISSQGDETKNVLIIQVIMSFLLHLLIIHQVIPC